MVNNIINVKIGTIINIALAVEFKSFALLWILLFTVKVLALKLNSTYLVHMLFCALLAKFTKSRLFVFT